jgi:hypothetical protein
VNQDAKLIFEAYNKRLNEGLFDQARAQAASAVGTIKGLGQQAAGVVKGAIAGAAGNVAGVQAAAAQRQQGALAGQVAKIEKYRAIAAKKLEKTSQEIFNDLRNLGVDLKGISSRGVNVFVNNLNNGFNQLIKQLEADAANIAAAAGQQQQTQAQAKVPMGQQIPQPVTSPAATKIVPRTS